MSRRDKGLNFAKRHKVISSDTVREVMTYIAGISVAIVVALFLVVNFGMKTVVIGVSMQDTLYNGQTVLINKLAYLIFKPQAGDIIVFKPNGNENTHYYVKRVVAVPGDTVEFRDGTLYVNGIAEEGDTEKVYDAGIAQNPIVLGTDEYFVLGDNRNNSEDSRSGNIGPVSKSLIEGRAWFKFSCRDNYLGFIK